MFAMFMKTTQILVTLVSLNLLAGCSRSRVEDTTATPLEISPQATPTNVVATTQEPAPKVVPTPHPASGATEAAIKLFPELAKKDTMFNRTFRDLYHERKLKDPDSLARPGWPIEVAQETGKLLSILPAGATSAGAVAQVPAETTAKEPSWIEQRKNQTSALERGAYDQHRVMIPRYYYTDPQGRFWIDPYGQRHYY